MKKDLAIFISFIGLFCTFVYFLCFHSFYKAGDCLVELKLRDKNEFTVNARITVMQIEKVGYHSYLVNNFRPIDGFKIKRAEGKHEINPVYNLPYNLSNIYYKRAEKSICEKVFKKEEL